MNNIIINYSLYSVIVVCFAEYHFLRSDVCTCD